jgi:hypothetical protein
MGGEHGAVCAKVFNAHKVLTLMIHFAMLETVSSSHEGTKYARSVGSLTVSHASQSDLVVLCSS